MKGTIRALPAVLAWLTAGAAAAGVPIEWTPRGPGGGGALFAPCFNPHQPDELIVNCDMSQIFRTTDLGRHWETVDFRTIQGGNFELYPPQFTSVVTSEKE